MSFEIGSSGVYKWKWQAADFTLMGSHIINGLVVKNGLSHIDNKPCSLETMYKTKSPF